MATSPTTAAAPNTEKFDFALTLLLDEYLSSLELDEVKASHSIDSSFMCL